MSLCRSVSREEGSTVSGPPALAAGYVATDMSEFKHDVIAPTAMITVNVVVEMVTACPALPGSHWFPKSSSREPNRVGYALEQPSNFESIGQNRFGCLRRGERRAASLSDRLFRLRSVPQCGR